MKFLFRWLFRLLLLAIVLLVAFILLVDTMAKALTERAIKKQTGLDVSIGRMEVGLLNPKVHLENVVLYDYPEFGGAPMLNLPELHIEYKLGELMAGRMHLTLLRLNLAEIHFVEGKDGRMNFNVLDAQIRARTAKPDETREATGFKGIDTLNLSLGRLRFTSLKNPGSQGYYNLGVEHWIISGIKKEEELLPALHSMAKRKGLEALWERFLGKPQEAARH